jgi:hypothetical protein
VQLHRTSERRRRLQHAKRQFTRRWATVTKGMGLEAAAAPQMQQQRQMSVNGNGSASASSSVAGMKRRRPNAKAAPSQVAFGASPASASEQPAAAADGAAPGLPIDAQQQQQQQHAQQPSNWPVAAGPSLAPHTGGAPLTSACQPPAAKPSLVVCIYSRCVGVSTQSHVIPTVVAGFCLCIRSCWRKAGPAIPL